MQRQQAFQLLDLPAELRILIYEHLVVVGRVFFMPDAFSRTQNASCEVYSQYSKPDLSILRVSRQIHGEAEPVYLTVNLFVLPSSFVFYSPFRNPLTHDFIFLPASPESKDRQLFSARGLELIRHVSMSFCARGICFDPFPGMNRTSWDSAAPGYRFQDLTFVQRLGLAHNRACAQLAISFQIIVRGLMLFNEGLSNLEIDLKNSFCPFGCCRNVYARMEFLTAMKPRRVRVIGSTGIEEQVSIIRTWAHRMGIEERELLDNYRLTFGGEDPWPPSVAWIREKVKEGNYITY